MNYGDVHRHLLRSIAGRGVLKLTEAEDILRLHTGNVEEPVSELIKMINQEIRPFQQTIKITNDELTGEDVVIFLSLGFDETAKVQNFFSSTTLEYFRILIEEIISSDSRQISSINAINLLSKMKVSFLKTDAEKALNLWYRTGYLERIQNSYALGVRTIHEFEDYFRQNMPENIEECFLCKQIVFRGCNCPSCGRALHTRCLNKYVEKVKKWPCCKENYSESQLINFTPNESSRLNSEAVSSIESTQDRASPVYDDEMNSQESMDDLTQGTVIGVSQSVTRKRKRQRIK